ncbi:MAG TPA: carboxypeptidase regulatory-like domain-containing protein [Acidiferrobacterales bacterium]|nr:carboxypeptidase regulatory-like domain-containing protein [Acidiferrobacterales bacterium]
MIISLRAMAIAVLSVLLLGGCSAGISGSVRMVDRNNKPIADAPLEGIVVNMINTSSAVEQASHSVRTDKKGHFEAGSDKIKPGVYKIEVSEPGYVAATKTIEVKKSSRSVDLDLRQLPKGASQSYRGMKSDKDKIINPGEVNIQPPSM